MKKLFQLLLSFFALVASSYFNATNAQSALRVITADADVVAFVDAEKICSLAGISTADFVKMLDGNDSPIFEILSSLVAGDADYLHRNKPWCFGVTPHAESVMLILEVKDGKGLKRYFQQQVRSNDSISFYQESHYFGCYDSQTALISDGRVMIVVASDTPTDGLDFMEYMEAFSLGDNCFASCDVAKTLLNSRGELRVAIKGQHLKGEDDTNAIPDGLYAIVGVETVKNKTNINLSATATTPESQEYLASMNTELMPIKGALLKYIPSTAAAVIVGAKNASKFEIAMPPLNGVLGDANIINDVEFDEVLARVEGDIVLYLDKEQNDTSNYLPITLICESKDSSIIGDIVTLTSEAQWQAKGDGYVGKMGAMPLYVSYHNGVFAISNSRDVTKLREESSPKKINIAPNSSLYADIDVKTLGQMLSKGSMMASIVGSQLQMEKIKINTAGNNQGNVEITFNGNTNLYQVFPISK
ncbi:MAG: hypothetical protein IKA01_03950 [Alistipes sp.]|nr:hypothetical protein [Alistipes sp.]MBR2629351.1 hypothetical protein [Alistipes sp.]